MCIRDRIKTFVNIPVWIYIPFAIIVMLATTNAVNLTDGIDGLATSVTTIIAVSYTHLSIRILSSVKKTKLWRNMVFQNYYLTKKT